MHRVSTMATCLLAAMVAGCTSLPTDYAASLPTSDPKWNSPQCEQARLAASSYEDKNLNLGIGLLMGPYGLALAAASREQSEKRRKAIARDLHMRCSSQPLPRNLEIDVFQAAT